MKCKACEDMLLADQTSAELEAHLSSCPSCQTYQMLLSNKHLPIEIENDTIQLAVNAAIEDAKPLQHRKNVLSTFFFLIIASCIASLVVLATYYVIEKSFINYLLVMSSIMPISLPVITYLRKKVIFK